MSKSTQQNLVINISLAEKIGLNESIVLQQFFYHHKKNEGSEWIYNSYKTWQEELKYFSLRRVRELFKKLVKQGFLQSKRGKRGKLYKLNFDTSNKLLLDINETEFHLDRLRSSDIKQTVMDVSELSNENKAQQMLDIWQKKIPAVQILRLTPQRKERLQSVFTTIFDSSLEKWTSFVDKITKSEFLMGKVTKFRIFLDWAIVPDHAIKILEGSYSRSSNFELSDNLPNKVNNDIELIPDENWKETAKLLVQMLGMPTYRSWFSKIAFKSYAGNCIYLEAETRFISDWVDGHYSHKIRRAWSSATNKEANSVVIKPKQVVL